MSAANRSSPPLRAALLYTTGQSLGGRSGDDQHILRALRAVGLDVQVVDLAHLELVPDEGFLVHDPRVGTTTTWKPPHAALMYHGAVAPTGSLELLRAIEASGTVVVNGSSAWPVFSDKYNFAEYMLARDVAVIPTARVTSRAAMHEALRIHGGAAIFKEAVSTEGAGVYVVRSAAEVDALVERLANLDGLVAQPVVDSRSDRLEPGIHAKVEAAELGRRHEFRINTARMPDGSVRIDAAYMRIAPDDHQVINNVAQGARAIAIDFEDLDHRDQLTIRSAAEVAPPSGDLVGWDLIGQPGARMIIEGNSGSGLPDGSEGIDPRDVVVAYGVIVRAAAERSPLVADRSHD